MNEDAKPKIVLAVFMLVFAGAGLAVYFFVSGVNTPQQPEPAPQAPPPAPEPAAPEPAAPEPAAPEPAEAPAPEPEKPWTDERIREVAAGLSKHPELARWLMTEHILGKFTATVEAIATGKSPRMLVLFLQPEGRFEVVEKGGQEFMSAEGFARYDLLAEAFDSLDADGLARLYRQLRPDLDKTYAEFARPGQTFEDALAKAITELLEVPVVTAAVPLKRIEVTLEMAVPELEAMSQAQKHLFRMGPDNVKKIQAKLRDLARALGLPVEVAGTEPIACPICPSTR